jgi:hypothetical protein
MASVTMIAALAKTVLTVRLTQLEEAWLPFKALGEVEGTNFLTRPLKALAIAPRMTTTISPPRLWTWATNPIAFFRELYMFFMAADTPSPVAFASSPETDVRT